MMSPISPVIIPTRLPSALSWMQLCSNQLFQEFEIDLGYPARTAGSFDVPFTAGCPVNSPVRIQQAAAPYTDKGPSPDEAEMDAVTITAYALTATMLRCYYNSPQPIGGSFKFNYQVKQ